MMRDLEGLIVETGRTIHRRYLLQRLIKQGQTATVYQGFDQVLQRAVAIKVVSTEYMALHRTAIRTTAQFSHPNIIGLYDLIVDSDRLYGVQEYVDGDDFPSLLQKQLTSYQIVDLGLQICQALIFAGSASRKICHGDLTPSAILRDRWGLVRINNFALPSDLYYFTAWSGVGGDGISVSDRELPWGQQSEARSADDTRAVGLLLYQLLTGLGSGKTIIEPPPDGRLRFQRSVPPELCDSVARAIVRQHPQRIMTPDVLHAELKALAESLEPPPPAIMPAPNPYPTTGNLSWGQPSPVRGAGQLVAPAPVVEVAHPNMGSAPFSQMNTGGHRFTGDLAQASAMGGVSVKLAAARQAAYPQNYPAPSPQPEKRRLNLAILLGLGALLFTLFFVIGYFISQVVLAP